MVPRLDTNGQPVKLKIPNKQTGKTVKEQRLTVDTFSEFYITEKNELDNFINMFAVNSDVYNWNEHVMIDEKTIKKSSLIVDET